ncbi:hypothetical protein Ancab_034847 [Ancistrocladus abbreviatus]
MAREDDRKKENLNDRRQREVGEVVERRELELEAMQIIWAKREFNRRLRLGREFKEDRRWRMIMEEKREEEKMEWRERLVGIQMLARTKCKSWGSWLGFCVNFLGQQVMVLQNLQHSGGLGDNGKPDVNSRSEFI